ncbi:MAG TPA: FKBP-type peptidyl-prolyl cis-trans isomerase [Chitinophagaceae bacterium]|nr:FKBP-type peptidyl-prolyl cis-trans isomerase [Chitinophagaceae bacterium]
MSIQNKLKQFMTGKIDRQKQEGIAFLRSNKIKEGVIELPEGLQYIVLKEGSGSQPALTDTVKAHYKGMLLNGKEFDNSFKRGQPFTAPLRSLIKGWQIALPLMKEGSHWRLWIPSELAYGDQGAGADIPGGATLIFEVELISIIKN